VQSLEALLLLGFGPRLPSAVSQLAEALSTGLPTPSPRSRV
jgi:ABC-type hemin transport system substrate-binding protein